MRIGRASGSRKAYKALAREAYLAALFHARQQGSLDGLLRTAQAFAALGDREMVDPCLHLAERLAARTANEQARAGVRAFKDLRAANLVAAENDALGP